MLDDWVCNSASQLTVKAQVSADQLGGGVVGLPSQVGGRNNQPGNGIISSDIIGHHWLMAARGGANEQQPTSTGLDEPPTWQENL